MSTAGCCGLYIGVESGSPRMLDYVAKQETVDDFLEKFPILHDNGIKTYTTWIFGLPTETRDDRSRSDELLAKLKPTSYDRFVYIGIPKSVIYSQLDEAKEYDMYSRHRFDCLPGMTRISSNFSSIRESLLMPQQEGKLRPGKITRLVPVV